MLNENVFVTDSKWMKIIVHGWLLNILMKKIKRQLKTVHFKPFHPLMRGARRHLFWLVLAKPKEQEYKNGKVN